MRNILIAFGLLLGNAYCGSNEIAVILTPKGNQSETEQNKQVAKEFYSAFALDNWNTAKEFLTNNYEIEDADTLHTVTKSKFPAMSNDVKKRMKAYHDAFPGFTLKVDEVLAEGNKVLCRISLTGVHKGSFLGIEPTGKTIRFKIFSVLTMNDGQITHITELWNEFSVMKQLGYLLL